METYIDKSQSPLEKKILTWRGDLARKNSITPYFILTNGVIRQISDCNPQNIEALYSVKGIGLKKIEAYGISILKICSPDYTITEKELDLFVISQQIPKKKKINRQIHQPANILDMLSPHTQSSMAIHKLKPVKCGDIKLNISKPVFDDVMSTFSKSQKEAFEYYKKGYNFFITGQAGCGKTYLLRQIIKHARITGKQAEICALTGCAALLLNCKAKTLHSWACCGITKGFTDEEIMMKYNITYYLKKNWKNTNILIIDEVSMLSKRLYNLLDKIGRMIRERNKPFGGIQVILSGDFHQLPPIGDYGDEDSFKFCFESKKWKKYIHKTVVLRKMFRQSEPVFMKILKQIRRGGISRNSFEILKKHVDKKWDLPVGMKPTILLPKKMAVSHINNLELAKIEEPSRKYEYRIVTGKKLDNLKTLKGLSKQYKKLHDYLLKSTMFGSALSLKKGAQVMCITNLDLDQGICNGSTGIVTNFSMGLPVVRFSNGVVRTIDYHNWVHDRTPTFALAQIPLILAWAVTIHKSQGATLDFAEIDIGSGIFEHGQTYVALSRVKNLSGLYIKDLDPSSIKAHPKVKKFYKKLKKKTIA